MIRTLPVRNKSLALHRQPSVLEPQTVAEPAIDNPHQEQQVDDQVGLRRYSRQRRPVISSETIVYLYEHGQDLDDPLSFSEAMNSSNATEWYDAMKDEMQSMDQNAVWDLVELPEGAKPVGFKWVLKQNGTPRVT